MGERRSRWGLGYQDKVATSRILEILRAELRSGTEKFEGVRLADLSAGRVDDFVLAWKTAIQGNSLKWSEDATEINWGELIGSDGLLKELADGLSRLKNTASGKIVTVRLETNRPPSAQQRHSQLINTFSVREFLREHWKTGPMLGDRPELEEAWAKIAQHVGLQGEDFRSFVGACELILESPQPPLPGPDSNDRRHYLKQFDDLHKAIATWITDHPDVHVIERQLLLEAIGIQAHQPTLIQRFPLPSIPYEKNGGAALRLLEAIEKTSGGYLAITGPAGIGKSTLVQDVLSGHPFFVPYYAFLPDGQGNPRERGESLTFFQDVVARLDRFYPHRYSLGVKDIDQGRSALREHMAKANELFVATSQKTILLIDGLDHVAREVGLGRSVLLELPPPDTVPDGFLIILSTQPQALLPTAIERHVSAEVREGTNKRIEIEGLTRADVHAVVHRSKKHTSGSERDDLAEASGGNPLILTYLLKCFEAAEETTVSAAIAKVGNYSGDIEKYYTDALSAPLGLSGTRTLLGLLSRAAPLLPASWLQEWPEQVALEDLFANVLAPFVRDEDGQIYFVHNSLISFLKNETRSRLPGADLEKDERAYHSTLADRCGNAVCADPLGRAKILHLWRSRRSQELLNSLSSNWVRDAISAFLPYSEIRPLILLGLEAAWAQADYSAVIRLVLLDHELNQRTSRLEQGELAKRFLELDRPFLAVSQIRSCGRIVVEDKVALTFAARLWHYATEENRQGLREIARTIYLQAKPIRFLCSVQPVDTSRDREFSETIQSWAGAAPLFEEPDKVIKDIYGIQLDDSGKEKDANLRAFQASLLYDALVACPELKSAAHKPFLDALSDIKQPEWHFAGLLAVFMESPSPSLLDDLEKIHSTMEADEDFDLLLAMRLFRNGRIENARKIASQVKRIKCDDIDRKHAFGLNDISFTVMLSYLQRVLELPEEPSLIPSDDREEVAARIERAARQLALVLGSKMSIHDMRNVFRSVLLFHNQPVRYERYDRHKQYLLEVSKRDLYSELIEVALHTSGEAISALTAELQDVLSGPAGDQFRAFRRLFARKLFEAAAIGTGGALKLCPVFPKEADDDDPIQRQEACLDAASFLHTIGGDPATIEEWILRASKVSAGAGSHKDYHMAQLCGWLTRSVETPLDSKALELIDAFVRAIEVAGGAGGTDAASDILSWLVTVDPERAIGLAVELIDRDVLYVVPTLEAVVIGASKASASPGLLEAIYCRILSLFDVGDTSEAASCVLACFAPSDRVLAAERIVDAVRTNPLPTHRVKVARALQDQLRQDGFGEFPSFIDGLKPGHDDSSERSYLYKLHTGEVQTTDLVAKRLGDPNAAKDWNPNPAGNAEFDWWRAIKRTTARDVHHLDLLLSTFVLPDYRIADSLAWKSEQLLKLGDRIGAKQAADEVQRHVEKSSWLTWVDGGRQKTAYAALKPFDSGILVQAREHFGKDLSTGSLYMVYLLDDIVEIFQFLELEWPVAGSRQALRDYLSGVLAANRPSTPYSSLSQASASSANVDVALCRLLSRFLAFPVIDLGVGARQALSDYASADGAALVTLFRTSAPDSIAFEHLLASVHIGLRNGNKALLSLQNDIENLRSHESIAIRCIARRICEERGWDWQEIKDVPRKIVLVTPTRPGIKNHKQAEMIIDSEGDFALADYGHLIDLLEKKGNDREELTSEFVRFFDTAEKAYPWTDQQRFHLWKKLSRAQVWLRQSVFTSREAVMTLIGTRALSGRAFEDVEQLYDYLYPIYDPALEQLIPAPRPQELLAMDWDLSNKGGESWRRGERASNWTDYQASVSGLRIIGERTLFMRPDWEWPREERYRGLLLDSPNDNEIARASLGSGHELTYETYLAGAGQNPRQLIVWNRERQLFAPCYRWSAINSRIAKELGWQPSKTTPFEWVASDGELMVKSLYWRDGWTDLEPAHFEALGYGWLVLATANALQALGNAFPHASLHLWVERQSHESHGRSPYNASWHLSSPVNAWPF